LKWVGCFYLSAVFLRMQFDLARLALHETWCVDFKGKATRPAVFYILGIVKSLI